MSMADPKFLKFIYSLIILPVLIFLKKNTPSIENIKKISSNNPKTFAKDGSEKVIVWIKA